ncbi:PREDICTED: cathepsin G-like [Hipposideros armiger]|uniref:Cathepsin G-like n=1 Tax=Hipposideros armiger TaxID=186990 RepID=A0A8B7SYV3_HIPAR|nr:PREDICTED: cathepsin G-like [Hipposideros armiger]
MQLLLLLVAFLLPPRAGAGEIIGGNEARPHSHPYMAYLLTESPRGLSTCGGFLVREDFVMTAARCLGSPMYVILGAHNIRRQERTQQNISVLTAITHPGYNEQNNLNDIMLLQLQNGARLNRFVRPVALPQSQARLCAGAVCTVAGWGLVTRNRRTDTLREVQLTVQKDEECSSRFDVYNGRRQICVGDRRQGKTTFRGDTGGPLVCNNVAQGVVSYGRRRGSPPAVFTRIARFLPWINNTMRRFKQREIKLDPPPVTNSSPGWKPAPA